MTILYKLLFVILFNLFFFNQIIYAQVSSNIPIDSFVYKDIEKLIALGLVDNIIYGQRPFSKKEIARIIAESKKNIDHSKRLSKNHKLKAHTLSIIHRLENDFQNELLLFTKESRNYPKISFHPLSELRGDMLLSNSDNVIPFDNGVGLIDTKINPLLQNQHGRNWLKGHNFSLESKHHIRIGKHFLTEFNPRIQLANAWNNNSHDNNFYIQGLYTKLLFDNFELEMGRDSLTWGQSNEGGLLLSNNPRGLDMIKISNDTPFKFPWIFKYLGNNKFSFFYADLGPEQNFPHTYLVGYKWSLQPTKYLELGASIMTQSGGEGSPKASFINRVKDALPLGQILQQAQVQVGNKLGGFDLRLRIPKLYGLELFGEMVLDDTQSPITNPKGFFVWEAGYIGGIYLPQLNPSGKLDLRLEFHKTGTRMYRHGQFISGWTENQKVLGSNLGPDSLGAYLTSNLELSPNDLLTFKGSFEYRRNDSYYILDITNIKWEFIKTLERPHDKRYRAEVLWLHNFKKLPMWINFKAGYELAHNFSFQNNISKHNFISQITLNFDFEKMFSIKYKDTDKLNIKSKSQQY